ncbi:MAG: hypothetical protein ACI910_000610 [Oleispira sp.]|jgi:hypothetical protein
MKKILFLTTMILAVSTLAGCAGYNTKYQQIGKYRAPATASDSKINPKDIPVFIQEYPEGFAYNDGVIGIVDGYKGYEIFGEVKIEQHGPNTPLFMLSIFTIVGPMLMMNPGDLKPDEAILMMQHKASEMGGNAIIGAKIPHEDDRIGRASGIVVYIPKNS